MCLYCDYSEVFVAHSQALSCIKNVVALAEISSNFTFFIVNILTMLLTTLIILSWSVGKEVLLLMQALNTLATPEEKLAALCKKYADLVIYFKFNVINMDSIINLD